MGAWWLLTQLYLLDWSPCLCLVLRRKRVLECCPTTIVFSNLPETRYVRDRWGNRFSWSTLEILTNTFQPTTPNPFFPPRSFLDLIVSWTTASRRPGWRNAALCVLADYELIYTQICRTTRITFFKYLVYWLAISLYTYDQTRHTSCITSFKWANLWELAHCGERAQPRLL